MHVYSWRFHIIRSFVNHWWFRFIEPANRVIVTYCVLRNEKYRVNRLFSVPSASGAGETGGGTDRVDPAASPSVHDPATRNGHVQSERESDPLRLLLLFFFFHFWKWDFSKSVLASVDTRCQRSYWGLFIFLWHREVEMRCSAFMHILWSRC